MNIKNKLLLLFFVASCSDKEMKADNQAIFYYPNGKIKSIQPIKNSLADGDCFWFYPNGNLEQKITFDEGKKNGYAFYFYESGALASMRLFRKDIPVGYSEDFYDHSIGISKSIAIYNDSGKMTYRQTFDSTGKLLKEEGAVK